MPTNDATTPSTENNVTNAAALESLKPELMAIPASSLRPINLDIPSIILTVMGALGALRALRALIAAVLGEAAAVYVDKLPTYVQATSQAHTDYLIALAPADMQGMSDELGVKRDVLVSEATTLVKRKYLKAGELGELRGNVGFTNQIFDVFQVVTLLRKHWAKIESHTGVTVAELDSAERLAQRFTQVLADRDKAATETGELAEMRQRAYTGLLDTWDQVRRSVTYLRWNEGDADSIAPSLWAGRGGRKARSENGVDPNADGPAFDDDGEPATPVTPSPMNGGGPFMS